MVIKKTKNKQGPKKHPLGTQSCVNRSLFSGPGRVYGVVLVLLVSFIINCIGINWAVSGSVSWQPDSIEGSVCAFEMKKMFKQWTHKYPRGHYIINGIFYYPLIKHWEKHPSKVLDAKGQPAQASLTIDRLAVLAKISRWISACMSVLAVLAIIYIAYYLFSDYYAAILSGLALALSYLYVFFSHTGNTDLPALFWFLWASLFGIRAIQKSRWVDFLLLGFCASWLACTKEGNATYLVGLGLSLWAMHASLAKQRGTVSWTKAVLSFWNWKIIAAAVVFFAVFLLLNGFLGGADEFSARVASWKKVTDSFEQGYQGAWSLLSRACEQLYYGIGWPFLLLAVIGIGYFIALKKFIPLFFAVLPLLFYYLITIMNIHFTGPRFLLSGYPGICLLAGKTASDWLRNHKLHSALRYIPIAALYGLSLLYCIGLDMELCSDTRQRAEQWIHQHVSRETVFAASIQRNYAPRLHLQGYRQVCDWVSVSIPEAYRNRNEAYPNYLIISDHWLLKPNTPDNEFRKRLFQGQEHYSLAASFKTRYVYPARTFLAVAGWGRKNDWISPPIYIYEKEPPK